MRCGARDNIEPAPLTPGFYSCLFLVSKATGEWRPIIDISTLNAFLHCPSFTIDMPRSILGALWKGQWLTSLDFKDAYFHIGINPADRHNLLFCHDDTNWPFTVLPFGLSTSPRVFTKILKPVPVYAYLHQVKLHMCLDDWLINPGTHWSGSSRVIILAQVPVPKARVGYKPREIRFNPISGWHLSGDRAGHSCGPGYAITQEGDQMPIYIRGILDTEVTTCSAVAPSTWFPWRNECLMVENWQHTSPPFQA